MLTAGWIAVILEIILLLVWVYAVFFSRNGTDPAGKGIAMIFLLGLTVYIIAGMILLLVQRTWSITLVLAMAAVPFGFVTVGLRKQYGAGRKKPYR